MFEGKNLTFRLMANDTLGNTNNITVRGALNFTNITIQVNDTTIPTITINGTLAINNTNTTAVSISVVSWSINENNGLSEINISVDNIIVDDGCNKFKRFTTTADLKRNDSFSTSTDTGCTFSNGTHSVIVRARDAWGNVETVFHNFTVQSGSVPGLVFLNRTDVKSTLNNSNISSRTGINFTGFGGALAIANFTYISSCNTSATRVFTNGSVIYPFNESDCNSNTASANRTLTVTVTDTAGTSNTTVFGFVVDNAGPSIVIHTPTASQVFTSVTVLNISAFDSESEVQAVTYFLDQGGNRFNLSNISVSSPKALSAAQGRNVSFINFTINFTPGRHIVKISVNDTLGNEQNTSEILFRQTGPLDLSSVNRTIEAYLETVFRQGNVSNVSVRTKNPAGTYNDNNSIVETSTTLFEILFYNSSVNVSLTDFNGTDANWNASVAIFFSNQTSSVAGIMNNWTNSVLVSILFNNSVEQFLPDNDTYYGVINFPVNISGSTSTAEEFWWLKDENDLRNRTNISQCTSVFSKTSSTPCWNYTSGGRTIVFVPHMSQVVAMNDTRPPTIINNTPLLTQPVISFAPNITVSEDTKNCSYSYNASVAQSSLIQMEVVPGDSDTTCIGSVITNLTNGTTAVNITFYVYDISENLNQTSIMFGVNDSTVYNISSVTIDSVTSTGATVTVIANESINMSVNSTGSTSFTNPTPVSALAKSRNITLSSLTASTTYNLTVITCDRAGNCLTNKTLGFTTSAAEAAAAAAEAAAAGGGGGGAAAPSNIEASAGRQWDTLAAGSSGVLAINNEKIAVTGVVIDVKNAVTSPSITVESLTANPYTAPAAAKVYQYLNLKKSNIADSDASKITVKFKVAKSWLASNGVSEDKIALYRYSDAKWNALPTSKTGADTNFVLYESTTPGFSVFAVGSTEAPPAVTPPTEVTPTPEAPEAAPTPEEEAKPVPPAAPPAKKGLSRTTMALIAVVIIVIVAALGYFMMQRKKE